MTRCSKKPEDALRMLAERLVDSYGRRDLGRGHAIRDLVTARASRFEDAKVHAFVPILVERAVRSRLDATMPSR